MSHTETFKTKSNFHPVIKVSYLFSLVIFSNEAFEFFSQFTVLLAQFVVAIAVLLNLGLDVCECVLKVSSDFLPLQVIFTAPLKGLLLAKGTAKHALLFCKLTSKILHCVNVSTRVLHSHTLRVLLCLCSSLQSPSSLLRASTALLCSLCS